MSSFLKSLANRLLVLFQSLFIGKTLRASGDCGSWKRVRQTGGRGFALGHDFEGERTIFSQVEGFPPAGLGPGAFLGYPGQASRSQVSLFSRGGNSDQYAFLYEGRKLNGGFSGTYDLGQLSLAGLSSVEVIHNGPSSTLYGGKDGGAIHVAERPFAKTGKLVFRGSADV